VKPNCHFKEINMHINSFPLPLFSSAIQEFNVNTGIKYLNHANLNYRVTFDFLSDIYFLCKCVHTLQSLETCIFLCLCFISYQTSITHITYSPSYILMAFLHLDFANSSNLLSELTRDSRMLITKFISITDTFLYIYFL
jgi:hypothetical protein